MQPRRPVRCSGRVHEWTSLDQDGIRGVFKSVARPAEGPREPRQGPVKGREPRKGPAVLEPPVVNMLPCFRLAFDRQVGRGNKI